VTRDWSLSFADDQGTSGELRLTIPEHGPASYLARVEVTDIGVVVVEDHDIAPPRGAQLVVRAEGLWAELVCETPGEHWSFGLEAFGVRFDDVAEASASDRGERVAVGVDLEWEEPDHVFGEILVGRRRVEFDGRGRFSGG